jgi:flavin reductase (DIM6/NTAB) family NADH-FMN oxidoreductase RutF
MNERSGQKPFDMRDFRNALGMFPTGVAVVTAQGDKGTFVGLTVNSFSSLSLDPPLVLWSLYSRSPSMRTFERASHFAINILSEDQLDISRRFATPGANKFAHLDIAGGLGAAPLIQGCAAHIECRAHAQHLGGDHLLFIGHVERYSYDPSKRPLVFHGGRYRTAGDHLG